MFVCNTDIQVQCGSGTHWLYIIFLAMPLFVLYVAGLPLYVFKMLRTPRNLRKVLAIVRANEGQDIYSGGVATEQELEQKAESSMGMASEQERQEIKPFYHNYAFLFLGYSERHYYWESVVLLRKALIAFISVVFVVDARVQGIMGLTVLLLCVALQVYYKPFQETWLNTFELLSLSASSVMFFFGLFTLDAGDTGSAFTAASALAFLVNLAYFGYLAHSAYHIFYVKHLPSDKNEVELKDNIQHKTLDSEPDLLEEPEVETTEGIILNQAEEPALDPQQVQAQEQKRNQEQEQEQEQLDFEKRESDVATEVEEVVLENDIRDEVDPNDVKANWQTKKDKKTGKNYYVNNVTKARVWKKPNCLKSRKNQSLKRS